MKRNKQKQQPKGHCCRIILVVTRQKLLTEAAAFRHFPPRKDVVNRWLEFGLEADKTDCRSLSHLARTPGLKHSVCHPKTEFHDRISFSYSNLHHMNWSGDSSVLERRTRGDWKVAGSSPRRSGGRIFFSRVNFLCWLLFRYPFHPRVTAVARKRSLSFCQKCRWQVTAKLAFTLHACMCGFAWSDVTWCMVVWCTQYASRRQQFCVAPAM